MNSRQSQYLVERWQYSPWKEAIEVLVDPMCDKRKFGELLSSLYPKGDHLVSADTFRGKGEFFDFRGINFFGKNLQGVDFIWFDLSGGVFDDLDISGVVLTSAKLYKCSFARVKATEGARFEGCFAKEANFNCAHLVGVDFNGADLEDANFSDAILERCDFTNARFRGAIFAGTRMIDCKVSAAHFSNEERNSEWLKLSTLISDDRIIWIS